MPIRDPHCVMPRMSLKPPTCPNLLGNICSYNCIKRTGPTFKISPRDLWELRASATLLVSSQVTSRAWEFTDAQGAEAVADTCCLVRGDRGLPWKRTGSGPVGTHFGFVGWGLGHQTPGVGEFFSMTTHSPGVMPRPRHVPELASTIPVSRDVEFFNRYDAATRESMEEGVARRRLRTRVLNPHPGAGSCRKRDACSPQDSTGELLQ